MQYTSWDSPTFHDPIKFQCIPNMFFIVNPVLLGNESRYSSKISFISLSMPKGTVLLMQ